MKVLLILSVLMIVSCGKVDLPVDSQLHTLNSIKPQAMKPGSSEHSKIKEVCDALATKTLTLSSLVNTDYVFGNTRKECADTGFTNMADAAVKLVNQSGIKFAEGVNLFYFSDVESSNEGVLSIICNNINNLSSPIPLDAATIDAATNLLYFTASSISPSDCSDVTFERCLKIERAVKVVTDEQETMGRVHTREWIRTRLEQPRLGFWTFRKRIAEAGCLEGQYFGRTATLK